MDLRVSQCYNLLFCNKLRRFLQAIFSRWFLPTSPFQSFQAAKIYPFWPIFDSFLPNRRFSDCNPSAVWYTEGLSS